MKKESREQLELFLQLAEKVRGASYTKKIEAQGGTNLKLDFKASEAGGGTGTITHNFPEGESVVALASWARQFVQQGDIVSLRQMARLLDDDDISDGWKARFKEVREYLTNYLCGASMLVEDQHRYTHREVLDIFVCGGMAHHEPAKVAILKRWKTLGFAYAMLEREFHEVVNTIISGIGYMYGFTQMELKGESIPMLPAGNESSEKIQG